VTHQEATDLEVVELGTRWPLPPAWTRTGPGAYEGPTGILSVRLGDGSLIDDERCKSAEESRPADWRLVVTGNGTALAGTYLDEGARVLVYCVRADEDEVGPTSDPLPEIQATYVFVGMEERDYEFVRRLLEVRPFLPAEYGTLDRYGHSALGPVPVNSSWLPVDEYVDHSGKLGTPALGKGHLMLVGGGWVVFADASRCCGLHLEPKAWRHLDLDRVSGALGREAGGKGPGSTILDPTHAHVWGCPLGIGISYESRDVVGHLRGAGAFWTDNFGQVWHLRYWIGPDHSQELVEMLRDCCADESTESPIGG
jgi:hypothetical protein